MKGGQNYRFVCIDEKLFDRLLTICSGIMSVNEYVDDLLEKQLQSLKPGQVSSGMKVIYSKRPNLKSLRVRETFYHRLKVMQNVLKEEYRVSVDITSLLNFQIIASILPDWHENPSCLYDVIGINVLWLGYRNDSACWSELRLTLDGAYWASIN
jgi:hypothetical protein